MKSMLLFFILAFFTIGGAFSKRDVSSLYVECRLERLMQDAKGSVPTVIRFPFPSGKGEVHTSKGSLRWNSYVLTVGDGKVKLSVTEGIGKEKTSGVAEGVFDLNVPGKDSVEVEVILAKGKDKIPYRLQCGKE